MDDPRPQQMLPRVDYIQNLKPCWQEITAVLSEGTYSSELRLEILLDRIEARL
ncbi:hypothetical protein [Parasulfitobacter algicola]|uniref:Uncharacterized protein n=1 Tax=Parasulfitobacter algicola TaxID=2614809 RepID=A0ABX2ITX3_9RHOB|nr:hypothetical protein [Sulfitobacter algicola]NSX54277.1 hypothetical protein [Sulfitobacter algicola]